jgi:hypothetical protein
MNANKEYFLFPPRFLKIWKYYFFTADFLENWRYFYFSPQTFWMFESTSALYGAKIQNFANPCSQVSRLPH